jgi:cell division protein FtsQ
VNAHAIVDVAAGWARRPWIWAVVVLVLGAALAAALRYAPFFEVEQVSVVGNDQVSVEQVLAAAEVSDGTALMSVPVHTIEQRIETLDAVASASVTREWPDAVRIEVRERRVVGYIALTDGVGLVGSDGTVYRRQSEVPRTLPALTGVSGAVGATVTSGGEASSAAVFAVAESLPRELQRAVAQVEADDTRDVRVVFDDGVVVTWGSAASAAQKVSVVTLLRERKEWGRAFTRVDVSAPDAPALAP